MALSYKIIQSDKKIYYYIALWFVISWCWRAYCFYIVKADPMMMFIWTTQLPGMLDEFAWSPSGEIVDNKTTIL
jgi:hypothetical protein